MSTLRIGIRVNDTVLKRILFGGGSDVITFAAPQLIWDGDSSDTSPDFTGVFDFRSADGDEITLEFASDPDFTTDVATYLHTLTAGEIAGDVMAITVTTLADGSWYARAKQRRGTGPWSDWSEPEPLTVAAVIVDVLLMEDGASKYLMEDGSSYYLLE